MSANEPNWIEGWIIFVALILALVRAVFAAGEVDDCEKRGGSAVVEVTTEVECIPGESP